MISSTVILLMLSIVGLPSVKSQYERCPNPYNSQGEFYSNDDMGAACIMSSEGGKLFQGESITNGDCTLTMQGDGNLILSRPRTAKVAWQTGSSIHQVSSGQSFYTDMQVDADLVVYLYEQNTPDEVLPVFSTKTSQSTEVSELWMSDGSHGYCRLYVLGNQRFIYNSVISTEFGTAQNQRQYLLKSQILVDPHDSEYSMTLQGDCNLIAYSKRYGDTADIDDAERTWAAGYRHEGYGYECLFTQELDGSFSIYLVSESGEWDKVWSHTNYRMGNVPNCAWWITKVDKDGPEASCIQVSRE